MTSAPATDTPATKGRSFVAYVRVSTERQGRSGLGLEAQRAAIDAFLRPGDRLLAPVFVEVESGRREDRPELAAAFARCRATGATLLIAKLDRLARDVHFISGLMKQGVPFIATDFPETDPFMLHIRASVAEDEARRISQRTKAALAAAKARGVKLGGDRGHRPATAEGIRKGAEASAESRARKAGHHAHGVLPVIAELRNEGFTSLNQLAAALTARGVASPRGGAWTATTVKRALARVAE
ncbi:MULTISPECIES: recombinase family protein [Roseomonadaceae]|uniref:Recombinase family protein n=1 Tax=Falsiroseomonas oleicola TaxID=2801474 RepID=A0ABS6HBC2_9PROT|nr:recombinase family protein [Roseomonas oleicola]MBU8544781.1 recombinase family protein [Roseomonas oleicola]